MVDIYIADSRDTEFCHYCAIQKQHFYGKIREIWWMMDDGCNGMKMKVEEMDRMILQRNGFRWHKMFKINRKNINVHVNNDYDDETELKVVWPTGEKPRDRYNADEKHWKAGGGGCSDQFTARSSR